MSSGSARAALSSTPPWWRNSSGNAANDVVLWGGGSPKNFLLQTEPQIQEVLGIAEKGHDYFLAVTDARPDHRNDVTEANVRKRADAYVLGGILAGRYNIVA